MISLAEDAEAQAFLYATEAMTRQVQRTGADPADRAVAIEMVGRYFDEWLTPDLITAALGELVARGEVEAAHGTRLQAKIDHWTTDTGDWRW